MGEKLYFPLFFDLSDKNVLVAGGGRIAARRIKTLLPFVGRIIVAAPECSEELIALAAEGRIEHRARLFVPSDLDGAALALCATGDADTDAEIRRLCAERGIPVNVASDRDKCDFYFPGIARQGSVVVGVTAGGTDHKKARAVTQAIRELFKK